MSQQTRPSGKTIDWRALRECSTLPKLHDVSENPRHLCDNYYQLGETEYAFASFQSNYEHTEKALFVLEFYWAPHPTIFARMRSRDSKILAADTGETLAMPEALKLCPKCDDCEQIKQFAEENKHLHQKWLDKYDYDFVKSGSVFGIERLTYYFRSPQPVPSDEAPYAVSLDMRGNFRWATTD